MCFGPTDIVNNHIKVYVGGRTLWVTYESPKGRKYVELLEDIHMPRVKAQSSGRVSVQRKRSRKVAPQASVIKGVRKVSLTK